MAPVDESPREDIEKELLEVLLREDAAPGRPAGAGILGYRDPLRLRPRPDRPALRRLGGGDWMPDPGRAVDAFFEVLSGHFAVAREAGMKIGGFQAGISYTPCVLDRGQSLVAFKPGRLRTAPATMCAPRSISTGPKAGTPRTSSCSASRRASEPLPVSARSFPLPKTHNRAKFKQQQPIPEYCGIQ